MRVGVIGLNHKIADLNLRETLAKACEERFFQSHFWHDDHTFLLLSTCNRTEIYFSSDDLPVTHTFLLDLLKQMVVVDFDQKLYSFFGYKCFLHLCRVIAGLDSAILGETEIQGQVKIAYEKAAQAKRLPKELHYLFQKGLKVGKGIRTHFTFEKGIPDLEHAIFGLGHTHFFQPETKKILFLGASAINCKIIHHFKGMHCERITLCNRTDERGKRIATHHGIDYLPWSEREKWPHFDWIVLGTKAQEYILRPTTQCRHKKLLIDLSVPRNADPMLSKEPNVSLFDIDQIHQLLDKRKELLKERLDLAEHKIALETVKQIRLFHEKRERAHKIFC